MGSAHRFVWLALIRPAGTFFLQEKGQAVLARPMSQDDRFLVVLSDQCAIISVLSLIDNRV
jgi:hypothetical protein